MIVVEHKLRDIFNMFPQISVNGTNMSVKFHWGDKKELNRYLKLKEQDSYPLIWLLPGEERHLEANDRRVERRCTFIIAYLETEVDLFNDERYINSFDIVLNPLTHFLQQAITNSGTTQLIGTDGFTVRKFPNYSETERKDKNGTIDLWDAVQVTCNVEFNNFCLNQIAWLNLI